MIVDVHARRNKWFNGMLFIEFLLILFLLVYLFGKLLSVLASRSLLLELFLSFPLLCVFLFHCFSLFFLLLLMNTEANLAAPGPSLHFGRIYLFISSLGSFRRQLTAAVDVGPLLPLWFLTPRCQRDSPWRIWHLAQS